MSTITDFKEGLKKHLRTMDPYDIAEDQGRMGSTQTGWMEDIQIDWEELDKAIDQFALSFKVTKP